MSTRAHVQTDCIQLMCSVTSNGHALRMHRAGSSVRLKPQGPGPKRTARYNEHFPPLLAKISAEKNCGFLKKIKHLTVPVTMRSKNFRDVDSFQSSTVHQWACSRFQASGPGVTVIWPWECRQRRSWPEGSGGPDPPWAVRGHPRKSCESG